MKPAGASFCGSATHTSVCPHIGSLPHTHTHTNPVHTDTHILLPSNYFPLKNQSNSIDRCGENSVSSGVKVKLQQHRSFHQCMCRCVRHRLEQNHGPRTVIDSPPSDTTLLLLLNLLLATFLPSFRCGLLHSRPQLLFCRVNWLLFVKTLLNVSGFLPISSS